MSQHPKRQIPLGKEPIGWNLLDLKDLYQSLASLKVQSLGTFYPLLSSILFSRLWMNSGLWAPSNLKAEAFCYYSWLSFSRGRSQYKLGLGEPAQTLVLGLVIRVDETLSG
jgi:hypothetical protein